MIEEPSYYKFSQTVNKNNYLYNFITWSADKVYLGGQIFFVKDTKADKIKSKIIVSIHLNERIYNEMGKISQLLQIIQEI